MAPSIVYTTCFHSRASWCGNAWHVSHATRLHIMQHAREWKQKTGRRNIGHSPVRRSGSAMFLNTDGAKYIDRTKSACTIKSHNGMKRHTPIETKRLSITYSIVAVENDTSSVCGPCEYNYPLSREAAITVRRAVFGHAVAWFDRICSCYEQHRCHVVYRQRIETVISLL